MDISELSYFGLGYMINQNCVIQDWDSGYFRIELFRTRIVDISELSYLGLG